MAFAKLSIVLVVGLAAAAPAMAVPAPHPADVFKFLSAKQVEALTQKPGPGPWTSHLAEHPGFDVEYALRADAGNLVEVHARTSHYIHILDGSGTLTYGGTVQAPKTTAPGEIRAASVSGGTVIQLHPGDYLQIPAGVPHMFNAARGTKLRYVVFNIKA